MNIYIANLSYNVSEDELGKAFRSFGQVETVKIIRDKYGGQSKGFGFVEMPSAEEARLAITDLNRKQLNGRTLKVNEARHRTLNCRILPQRSAQKFEPLSG
jgi:RNA recognition motif-containing protein